MALAIKPKSVVLFTGDSITDVSRRDTAAPLGAGYVRMVNDLIVAKYPRHNLKIINTGIGGNNIRDLANRWTDDVIRHQPDWLSIMIGVNDLHRWFYKAGAASVTAEEFADYYFKIMERVKKETKAQVVLLDPFYMSIDNHEASDRGILRKHLANYIKVVHQMAKQYKTRHIKLDEIFQQHLKTRLPEVFCAEPVHPNPSGHLLIAHKWLESVGF
jgi:lysophospholipase L1-like esterase